MSSQSWALLVTLRVTPAEQKMNIVTKYFTSLQCITAFRIICDVSRPEPMRIVARVSYHAISPIKFHQRHLQAARLPISISTVIRQKGVHITTVRKRLTGPLKCIVFIILDMLLLSSCWAIRSCQKTSESSLHHPTSGD